VSEHLDLASETSPKWLKESRNPQKTASKAIHGQRHSLLLTASAQTPFVQSFPRIGKLAKSDEMVNDIRGSSQNKI
jgi:hypothetical protein